MRKITCVLALVVSILALGGVAPVVAQEEGGEAAQLVVRPAEIYGCMFREGQEAAELRAGAARWNAWMDETGQHDYYAYLLRPHYRSRDHEADFLWMGGWPTGAMMGPSLERWVTEGGEVRAELGRIADCPYSANFALIHLSPRNPDPNGPVRFKNCKVAAGRAIPEALAAVRSWIAYEADEGIDAQHSVLFPAFGESRDADYDFKWVTASSWTGLGGQWDQYGNGGGWQKWSELFDGLLDCDTPRLYVSSQLRGVGGAD